MDRVFIRRGMYAYSSLASIFFLLLLVCGLLGGCTPSQLASVQTSVGQTTTQLHAACVTAGSLEPVLVPIGAAAAQAASANGAQTVETIDALGKAACQGINAVYAGTKQATVSTVTTPAAAPLTN